MSFKGATVAEHAAAHRRCHGNGGHRAGPRHGALTWASSARKPVQNFELELRADET
jgi:hypothetical protein